MSYNDNRLGDAVRDIVTEAMNDWDLTDNADFQSLQSDVETMDERIDNHGQAIDEHEQRLDGLDQDIKEMCDRIEKLEASSTDDRPPAFELNDLVFRISQLEIALQRIGRVIANTVPINPILAQGA